MPLNAVQFAHFPLTTPPLLTKDFSQPTDTQFEIAAPGLHFASLNFRAVKL